MAETIKRSLRYALTTDRNTGAVVANRTSNETDEHHYVSSPVSGSWITFPDGSRFRRSTGYSTSTYKFIPGSSEFTDFDPNGIFRWRTVTGPGGFSGSNYTSPNWTGWFKDDMGIPNTLAPPSFQTMETNEATTKALNQIADGKANLAENLATLGQTVRMFKSPVSAFLKQLRNIDKSPTFRNYLRRSYRDLVRGGIDKKISGKYLEYVYGFKPLMQDIYSLAEFAKQQSSTTLLISGRGSAHRDLSGRDRIGYSDVSNRRDESWTNAVGRARTTCTLHARIDPNYQFTRTLNQLGLVNPASLVWELIPYSFLVDWIVPIGPVLSALTAPAGLIFVDGSRARRVSASWQTRDDYRDANIFRTITSTSATGSCTYEGYTRQTLTSWPLPGFYYDVDPLRLRSDKSDRDLKGLALAIQRLR